MSDGGTRIEHDSLGPVEIATDRLWGPQTERSLRNFRIGRPRYVWDRDVIAALARVKRAAAITNEQVGKLTPSIVELITRAATEVVDGQWDDEFPLVVFQTGSGTQTNMNANEVIANRANLMAGAPLGANDPVHPNDHVNASQSSNDVFPTVMHLTVLSRLHRLLYPALGTMTSTLDRLADQHENLVKVGRTHLQDATPITLGQEIGAWASQIRQAIVTIRQLEPALLRLAIGGTATGTGLNAPPGFARGVVTVLSDDLGHDFQEADDHFTATSSHDAIVNLSAGLRTLAGALMKMSNDVRWLGSGPRNGIGELHLPANEPGSSIMPGKVNPTQAEALNMVSAHVFGNDATVAFAGTQGEFQLNVYKPIMLYRTLDSITLLADAVGAFTSNCLEGLQPNRGRITENLESNLMIVTALAPRLGYDRAADIAKTAQERGLTLRQAVTELGYLTSEDYDKQIDLLALAKPGGADDQPASVDGGSPEPG